jgi:hypothetical protein
VKRKGSEADVSGGQKKQVLIGGRLPRLGVQLH